MDWSLGQIVISKQGRDVGTVSVVIKLDNHYCYTADGRKTTFLKPKKKNIKHLQATHWVSESIRETLENGKIPADTEIRDYLNHHRTEHCAQEVPDVETRCN